MCAQPFGYVSVIGVSLLEAVVDLVGRLEATPPIPPNEVQTSQLENGYAAAIVVLSAAVMESALNRTRYVRGDGLAAGRESVTRYWERIGPTVARNPAEAAEFAALAADLDECFAVRDAIAHSHLWEAQVGWANSGALEFVADPQLRPGFGDQRFRAVLDPQTRQSRKLSLNLFPSRIWRRDAWVTLKIAARLLAGLEALDRRYFYLSPQTFQFHGVRAHFHEMTAQLPNL